MTVNYSLDVASSSFLCLYKLLFRWKGSVWKSVWAELLIWLGAYYIISLTYRFAMNAYQRELFEDICIFFYAYSDYIPVTFMLGFYVSTVFTRWWEVIQNIGWVDSPMLLISCVVRGADDKARILRRNIIRYLVLTQAMVLRDVSAAVKKRFPTMQHLVTAGLMTEKEMKVFDEIESQHAKYWTPMHWVFSLCRLAREEGYINSDIILVDLLEKLRQYRVNVLNLTIYDWVPVPLVYTQVVHLAVRSFFFIGLFSRQYLDTTKRDVSPMPNTRDIYVPVMSIFQFICFVGWMKVAEVLLNPLGEDDDDVETNWILDRNLQVAFLVVDDAYGKFPTPEKDPWWDMMHPEPLYTAESAARTVNPQVGSCTEMHPEDDHFMVRPRRRMVSRSSKMAWEDVDEDDIVPVKTLDKTSNDGSVESLGFAQSIGNKSSRLNTMLRRISHQRNRRDSLPSSQATSAPRRHRRRPSQFASDTALATEISSGELEKIFARERHSSIASSINCFGDSMMSLPGEKSNHFYEHPKSSTKLEEEKNGGVWNVDETALPPIEEDDERRRTTDEESQRTMSSMNSVHRESAPVTTASMSTQTRGNNLAALFADGHLNEAFEEEDEEDEHPANRVTFAATSDEECQVPPYFADEETETVGRKKGMIDKMRPDRPPVEEKDEGTSGPGGTSDVTTPSVDIDRFPKGTDSQTHSPQGRDSGLGEK